MKAGFDIPDPDQLRGRCEDPLFVIPAKAGIQFHINPGYLPSPVRRLKPLTQYPSPSFSTSCPAVPALFCHPPAWVFQRRQPALQALGFQQQGFGMIIPPDIGTTGHSLVSGRSASHWETPAVWRLPEPSIPPWARMCVAHTRPMLPRHIRCIVLPIYPFLAEKM